MSKIVIEYTMPPGTNRDDIASFVHDALSSWGGQFHPDDPLFGSLRGLMTTITVNRKKFDAREPQPGPMDPNQENER